MTNHPHICAANMKYPIDAIEACEGLSHPLPHPSTDDAISERLFQGDGGARIDTQHPGPIQMFEPTGDAWGEGEPAKTRGTRPIFAVISYAITAIVIAAVSSAVVILDMATTGKAPAFPF